MANDERSTNTHNYLEPRVAKLETGLEILTRDVSSLAGIVRDQGSNIEAEIQKLAVAVTQAGAPKKTDWGTLISLAFLIIALGSAVFYPLSTQVTDIKENHSKYEQVVSEINTHQEQIWTKQVDLLTERINFRLNRLESNEYERNKLDLDELRDWRLKAMGLNKERHDKHYHDKNVPPKEVMKGFGGDAGK